MKVETQTNSFQETTNASSQNGNMACNKIPVPAKKLRKTTKVQKEQLELVSLTKPHVSNRPLVFPISPAMCDGRDGAKSNLLMQPGLAMWTTLDYSHVVHNFIILLLKVQEVT